MNIAIAVDGDTATAKITEHLEDASHLFIVTMEDNQCSQVIAAPSGQAADITFARACIEHNCEAIVCGDIGLDAFNILADAQISRYDGWLYNASQIRKLLYTGVLPLIRAPRGGDGCHGHAAWEKKVAQQAEQSTDQHIQGGNGMEFSNVKLVAQANVYFDGKVNSRSFYLENGERKTLGFMQSGEYEFGTNNPELMEVIGGSMDVLLPGETEWQTVGEGAAFNVPANSAFKVKVADYADYCCSYLPM